MRWFRLYTDILDDPKMKYLDDSAFRFLISLLVVACEQELDGKITLSKLEISWRVRRHISVVRKCLPLFEKLKIISIENDGLQFINWNKRQFKSDDVTERVKRFRNVTKSLHETPPETETETETEQRKKKASCSEPSKNNGSKPAAPPSKILESIPTNKNEEYPVTAEMIAEYARAYPAVDIRQQIRKMRAWAVSNPTKRKTKSGMPRFINAWLAKEQDSGKPQNEDAFWNGET